MLRLPPLQAEDGTEMLAYYYCERDPGRVLRPYNGYVSLVPNAIGYASGGVSIASAPILLALVPFLMAVACHVLPHGLSLYGDTSPVGTGFAASLLIAALPLGSVTLLANTTYSQWSGLLAVALLAIAPPSHGTVALSIRFGVSAALIWSHPLSVVTLPLFAWAAVRDSRERRGAAITSAALVAVGIAYQVSAVARDSLAARPADTLLRLGSRYLGERVVLDALLGSGVRVRLHEASLGWVATAIGALFAVCIAYAAWKRLRTDTRGRVLVAQLAYLIVGFTAASIIGRTFRTGWLSSPFGDRYFVVQRVLLWLLIAYLAAPLVARLQPSRRRLLALALGLYVLVIGYAERGRYAVPLDESRRVAAFVQHVAELEVRNSGRRGIDEVLERERGRPIHLLAPAENAPCEAAAPTR